MIFKKTESSSSGGTLFYFACATFLFVSFFYALKINMYHGELDIYLPHYLSDKSTLKIIFDPLCELDLTRSSFRGRELGNFFNFLDAKLLALTFKYRHPVFVSIIYYLCLISITVFLGVIVRKSYIKNSTSIQLLLLMLLSSPPVIFGGLFYRTNKIISATAILFVIILLDLIKRNPSFRKDIQYFFLFTFSMIASLSDEQGFALVLLVLAWGITKNISKKISLETVQKILIMSATITLTYRSFIGPYIFEQVNNLTASVPGVGSDQNKFFNFSNLYNSLKLLVKYFSYMFGNLSIRLTFVLITCYVIYKLSRGLTQARILGSIAVIASGLTLLIHVMTLKHPAIFWPDIVSYYSLPIVFFIFSMTYVSIQNITMTTKSVNRLHIALVIFIACNVLSWPENFRKITEGHIKVFRVADVVIQAVYSTSTDSRRLIESISTGETPGKISNMPLGEQGRNALKNSLQ